jgi:hypothetical protein
MRSTSTDAASKAMMCVAVSAAGMALAAAALGCRACVDMDDGSPSITIDHPKIDRGTRIATRVANLRAGAALLAEAASVDRNALQETINAYADGLAAGYANPGRVRAWVDDVTNAVLSPEEHQRLIVALARKLLATGELSESLIRALALRMPPAPPFPN